MALVRIWEIRKWNGKTSNELAGEDGRKSRTKDRFGAERALRGKARNGRL